MKHIQISIGGLELRSGPFDNEQDLQDALKIVAEGVLDDDCKIIDVPPPAMTTQQLDLSFTEIVFLEQAIAESIDRYKQLLSEYPEGSTMRKLLGETRERWQELLAKTTLMYPDMPRNWSEPIPSTPEQPK